MPQLAEYLLGFSSPYAYSLIFVILVACGFGVPIPEDITLIAAGILAYNEIGDVRLWVVIGLTGVMAGDSAMFYLGRRYGLSLVRRPLFAKIISESAIAQMSEALQQKGNRVLFAARFMPGLRSPLFFTAGALGVKARVFYFYDGMAALLSVPAIILTIYIFGHHMAEVINAIKMANYGIVSVIFLVAIVGFIKWKRQRSRAKL